MHETDASQSTGSCNVSTVKTGMMKTAASRIQSSQGFVGERLQFVTQAAVRQPPEMIQQIKINIVANIGRLRRMVRKLPRIIPMTLLVVTATKTKTKTKTKPLSHQYTMASIGCLA